MSQGAREAQSYEFSPILARSCSVAVDALLDQQPKEIVRHKPIREEFLIELDDIGQLIFIKVYRSLVQPL